MSILQLIIAALIVIEAALSLFTATPWRAALRALAADCFLAILFFTFRLSVLAVLTLLFGILALMAVLALAVRTDKAKMHPVPFKTYAGAAGVLATVGMSWLVGRLLVKHPIAATAMEDITAKFFTGTAEDGLFPSLMFPLLTAVLLALAIITATIVSNRGQ